MRAFINKIFEIFVPSIKTNKLLKIREKENAKLRANGESDINRWINNEELFLHWDERTLLLGTFINSNANVIEFGAGNMVLKSKSTNYKSYTPSDVVQRFEETIVCDLNQKIEFNLFKYDTAVFSGVLEYVYDIEKVIGQMRAASVKQIVLSYACADIVQLSRDKNGWLSDYTKTELEAIFLKNGYTIENYQEWRNQSLYNLIRK